MKALVDSVKAKFCRCLLENGDYITVSIDEMPENVKVGDVITVSFFTNVEASKQLQQMIENYKEEKNS